MIVVGMTTAVPGVMTTGLDAMIIAPGVMITGLGVDTVLGLVLVAVALLGIGTIVVGLVLVALMTVIVSPHLIGGTAVALVGIMMRGGDVVRVLEVVGTVRGVMVKRVGRYYCMMTIEE